MSLSVPIPGTFEAAVWFALGIQFGRSFGKKLDQEVQAQAWFKAWPAWAQAAGKRILDFTHHWWVGALIMLYAPGFWYWFGAGLLIDDLPDVPARFKKLLNIKQ